MYLCVPCVCLVPQRGEEDIGSLGTEVIGGCKPPCRCVLGTEPGSSKRAGNQ